MLHHNAPSTPRPRPPNFSRSRSRDTPGGHKKLTSSLRPPRPSNSLLLSPEGEVGMGEDKDEEDELTLSSPSSSSPTKPHLPSIPSTASGGKIVFSTSPSSQPSHLPTSSSLLQLPPPPYPSSPPPTNIGASSTPSSANEDKEPPRTPITEAAKMLDFLAEGAKENLAVAATAREGGVGLGGGEVVDVDWIKQKSKEELDRLLIEADRVIRERERELALAASIGKSLLENNVLLRNRQESLLSALSQHTPQPPTRRSRPSMTNASSWLTDNGEEDAAEEEEEREEGYASSGQTPTNSFGRHSGTMMMQSSSRESFSGAGDQGWVFGRPSSRISMEVIASSISNGFSGTVSPPRSKRVSTLSFSSPSHRRAPSLSASPQAISMLRDQNNELASQLEQLQAETSEADHEGRKKLRKLEREIGGLRGDLEKLSERNGELEERNGELEEKVSMKAVAVDGRDGGWGERRKARLDREWEEKSRKYGGGELVGSASSPVIPSVPRHESAPSGPGGRRTPSPTHRFFQQHAPSRREGSSHSSGSTLSPPGSPRTRSISLLGPNLSAYSSPFRNSNSNPSFPPPATPSSRDNRLQTPAELALVTQLIGKVRELERANEEMRIAREAMDKRISRAKREGAVLEGAYEVLEEEVERAGIEVVDMSDSNHEEHKIQRLAFPETLAYQPRTPSRQTGAAAAASRPSPSSAITPNKSPSTTAIELNFFSTSPSSTLNASTSTRLSSTSPSSIPVRPKPSSSRNPLPPSPSGSARFRSATGNRFMIESNKLTKRVYAPNFLSPSRAPGSSTFREARQNHSQPSDTSTPTTLQFGGGSSLKLRVDARRDNEDEEGEESGGGSPSERGRGGQDRNWEDEVGLVEGDGEDEDEDEQDDEEVETSPRADLTPRRKREIRLAAMPSIGSLASWGESIRGRGESLAARRGAGRKTLESELGSQVGGFFDSQPSFSSAMAVADQNWTDQDDVDADEEGGYSHHGFDDDASQDIHYPRRSQQPSTALVPQSPHLNPSDLALRSVHLALSHTETGLYLDTSTPILPPGSLAISPPADSHTFDLLDQAVTQRPIRWADDDDEQYGTSSSLEPKTKTSAVGSLWDFVASNLLLKPDGADPFETTVYPEPDLPSMQEHDERLRFRRAKGRQAVERGEDPLSLEALRPPTRRELALQRLGLEPGESTSSPFGTMRHLHDGWEDDEDYFFVEGERGGRGGRRLLSAPTDGPSDWLARMRPANVVERVGRSWVKGVMDVWFFLQIVIVALVFMMEAMKTGRKQMRAIDRQQQQQRRLLPRSPP